MRVDFRKKWVLFATVAMAPVFALAQSMDSMDKAGKLGNVLAAEEACGFEYNRAAIESWIDANVDPSDMEFAGTLVMMTEGQKYAMAEMSESSKAAHCHQIARTARHFEFMK